MDRTGRETDYTYAPSKKLTSVTRYLEHDDGTETPVTIRYKMDKMFNALNITEPRGRYVERYRLDGQMRVDQITNIEGQRMELNYFVDGVVKNTTRFDGSMVTNSYDSAGRKTSTTIIPAVGGASSLVEYDYYADSQLKTVSDGATSVSNGYDRLNRLTLAESTTPGISSTASYQYDPAGNMTNTLIEVGSEDIENTYTYDVAERLESIVTDAGTYIYAYNPANGAVASMSNTVSGITTSYAYDIMDRTTNITYSAADGSLIRALDYGYDDASMITNKVVNDGSKLMVNSYQYDSIDRLIGEERSNSVSSVYSVVYKYDLAGNRTSTVESDGGVASTNTYKLGVGNRLSSVTTEYMDDWEGIPTNLTETMNYGYDEAGNTTNITVGTKSTSLEWDERYRLIDVEITNGTNDTETIQYGYDVLGRKISRFVVPPSGGAPVEEEHYVYSGSHIVADLDSDGELLRTYTYGMGIDNILSMTVYPQVSGLQPQTYYYLKDHQNSVIALTDEDGVVVESYEYDAYGQVLDVKDGSGTSIGNQQSVIGNRYTFQGREHDFETGLTYFRARWYNPKTGRWLSKDPIGISGGLNLYEFCWNNPVNLIDPNGLTAATCGKEIAKRGEELKTIRNNIIAMGGLIGEMAEKYPIFYINQDPTGNQAGAFLNDGSKAELRAYPVGVFVSAEYWNFATGDPSMPRTLAYAVIHEYSHAIYGPHPAGKDAQTDTEFIEKMEPDFSSYASKYLNN